MPTIAECLRDEMLERGEAVIWSGDPDLCLAAYKRSSGTRSHPLNRIKSVIDAVRRSPLFDQDGYIRSHDDIGRQILIPAFKLRLTKPE